MSVSTLALIGYRGTGKTSVARLLALRLGWDWVDADVEIELRAGKSIATIFADDGEEAFRNLESQVLGELVAREKTVLALGGGVVLRAGNRELLRNVSTVVWLTASPGTLAKRIAADESTAARRPNLTVAGGMTEITAMLAQREPLYRQCATLEVDTENRSPGEVAETIVGRLPEMLRS